MYYRRKILLALLSKLGGKVSKLDLQKLLFLVSKSQQKAVFDFVPYKFGCYSFQAAADLSTLSKYRAVQESEKYYSLASKENYYSQLTVSDQNTINAVIKTFGSLQTNDLIKYVYKKFPYYAINSQIAEEILNKNEFAIVKRIKSIVDEPVLFTIGYEGISVEEYFNRLMQQNIKVLCDVRNFPRSMKFGFSKNQLRKICEGLGLVYCHLPGLGIQSAKRKNLESQKDYDELFKEYTETTLTSNFTDQKIILELLKKYKRVALTCFESNIRQCHRYHLAEAMNLRLTSRIKINHI